MKKEGYLFEQKLDIMQKLYVLDIIDGTFRKLQDSTNIFLHSDKDC